MTNGHNVDEPGDVVFRQRLQAWPRRHRFEAQGSAYCSGRSPGWLKMKNASAPAVKREAEEDWSKERRMSVAPPGRKK